MCSTFPAALRVRRTHLRRPRQNYKKAPLSAVASRQADTFVFPCPMNRVVTAISVTGLIFAGTQARAADSASQSKSSKHQTIAQIVGCMRKRMSADRSSSYNAAMKACKEQINKESDNLPSGALVASDTPARP